MRETTVAFGHEATDVGDEKETKKKEKENVKIVRLAGIRIFSVLLSFLPCH